MTDEQSWLSDLEILKKSAGNISSMVYYTDKNGCQWNFLLHDDLKRRLSSLFTIAPRVRVFKTGQHIFIHEFVFFFNVKTGALVNPDVMLPNDSNWLDIITVFDAKPKSMFRFYLTTATSQTEAQRCSKHKDVLV